MPASAAPYSPTNDNDVLERLPIRAGDETARELSSLRAAVAKETGNAQAVADLAQRYVDLSLARGDPRYVGYADAVVRQFSGPPSASLLTVRGVLRQYRHDFDGGLEDFAKALALDPDYAQAHAWRGAVFLVRADYASALQECKALANLGRALLAGGCTGLAQAYGGSLQSGYASLQRSLALASSADNRLWLLTRMAEVAAWQGDAVRAERHFKEALALEIDDVYLLSAWSDFLLDAGRFAEVAQTLARWESADSLLLRLAQAEALLQTPNAARRQQMLADRFAAARARGDTTHRAEESRFELHLRKNIKAALELASANYAIQREPRDARILLEAAVAARDSAAAQPARDWLRRSGFEDARLRNLARQSEQPAAAGAPVAAPSKGAAGS